MRYLLRRVFRNSRRARFALIGAGRVFMHEFLLHLQERLPTMRLLIAFCLLVSSVYAQAPGEVYVTPKIDLQLQPVAVVGLEDRTLNVPPGFVVELFAADIGKGRLMAWSPDSVLHVAVMGTRGSSEWRADPNRTGRVVALPDRDRDSVCLRLYALQSLIDNRTAALRLALASKQTLSIPATSARTRSKGR